MKKFYIGILLVAVILTCLCGFDQYPFNSKTNEQKVGKKLMREPVMIDPKINLSSDQMVSVIIEFIIKPAQVAVLEAKASGESLTLEEAKQKVEESHQQFQKELHNFLDVNHIPYKIRHTYKTALNGVSMELPGKEITRLLQSSVVERIHLNEQIHLDPPIQRNGQY